MKKSLKNITHHEYPHLKYPHGQYLLPCATRLHAMKMRKTTLKSSVHVHIQAREDARGIVCPGFV